MSGILSAMFGDSGEDAYKQLSKYLEQGIATRKQQEGSAESALNPYMGDPRLQNQFEQALSGRKDSQGIIDRIMSGYSESPYAKYLTGQGMKAIQNQSAFSGMHGSGAEGKAFQENAQNIASGDMQQYLANVLGLDKDYLDRLQALAGNESQNQFNARFGVSNLRNRLGESIAGDYANIGQSEAQREQARESQYNSLLGGIGDAAATIFGGPLGAIGNTVGSKVFGKYWKPKG
jgi:hypothetical protein